MNVRKQNTAPKATRKWDKTSTKSYSTSEVARIFGIEEHILRYWEQGTSLSPKRFPSGARRYTREDLEVIERLHYLVVIKGMTLKAAAKQLQTPSVEVDLELRNKLLQVRQKLTVIRSELDKALMRDVQH